MVPPEFAAAVETGHRLCGAVMALLVRKHVAAQHHIEESRVAVWREGDGTFGTIVRPRAYVKSIDVTVSLGGIPCPDHILAQCWGCKRWIKPGETLLGDPRKKPMHLGCAR